MSGLPNCKPVGMRSMHPNLRKGYVTWNDEMRFANLRDPAAFTREASRCVIVLFTGGTVLTAITSFNADNVHYVK